MIHTCKECGLKFTCPELFNTHLHQHAVEEEVEVEEEEAQAGGDTRADLRMSDGDSDEDDASDEENGGTDTGGDTADSWEVSAQKGVASWQAAGPASATATANLRNAYSCLACGKVYTYLVPFLKHQLEHKLHSELRRCERSSSSQRYSCSLCGMMFIRKVQLRAHMRIHGPGPSAGAVTPQCDQCGKTFASPRTWAAHMELHKQHLFWCLSCSKGFPDEAALDRHLQGHNRKQHTCNICRQSFTKVTELVAHYQGHTTAEAYRCSLCAKSFMFLGNFISHQKQHRRKTEHSSEIRSGQRKGEFSLSRKEKQRIDEPEAPGVGEVKTEDSDCGELSYQLKPSNPPVKSEVERVAPTAGEEVQEKEAGGAHLHGELQYWQWDCCVCDMGFDEVGKLHLHYVKHATGELPIPQEYV